MSYWRRVWPAGLVVFGIVVVGVMMAAMLSSISAELEAIQAACTAACGDDAVLVSSADHCECGGRQGKYYAKPEGQH